MSDILESVDDFKIKLQKQKYNLFGGFAFIFIIVLKLVEVVQKSDAPLYEILVGLALSLVITLLLWNNYYSSGKLSAKDMERYKTLAKEVDDIANTVLLSEHSKDIDEWCEKFSEFELRTAQTKAVKSGRIDYADFETTYSIMSAKDIKALYKTGKLTKKQVKAILKAARMRLNTEVSADSLLNEHGGHASRFSLGATEATLQARSTGKKGAKFLAFSLLSAYFGWKIIDAPSLGMVLVIIISALPYVATVIFAWKAGYEDVSENLMRRNQNRKRLLLQFCEDKKITLPPSKP